MNAHSGMGRLRRLARLYGVQAAYYDYAHRRREATAEALLAMLRAMGAPVAGMADVPAALRERQQAFWQNALEPVTVAWEGELPFLTVRLPAHRAEALLSGHLELEDGALQNWQWRAADLPAAEQVEIEGLSYLVKRLPLAAKLPPGYHRLVLEVSGKTYHSLIIAAPRCVHSSPEKERGWGVFLPLYALHTEQSWGSGNYSDLNSLMAWVGAHGGDTVATLPLLPIFIGENSDYSPYTPISRLFWNEFYLDVNQVPELEQCPDARELLAETSFRGEIAALHRSDLVDYPRVMARKRQVLEKLCQYFFARPSGRLAAYHRYEEENPLLADYARFRAAAEQQGKPWRQWPARLRDGVLQPGDYREEDRRYYQYAQWLAQQQMQSVAETAKKKGLKLYLDLPVGVHPDGYDVWRERDAFVLDASAGAPPDAVFRKGQGWGFAPLHPQRIRERGYRYVIAYLRHHLKSAGILRIDHMMGLHRLYCIPPGMDGSNGVYLRYHPEEMYAILTLESRRHGAAVVGEDLGTVPAYVRPAMKRHGLLRMYVLHYELAESFQQGVRPPAADVVASLNTHDMPPFASFWQGRDIPERLRLGILDQRGVPAEKKNLQKMKRTLSHFLCNQGWLQEAATDVSAVLQACLSFLASSRAGLVLVNLEDLWGETEPQNVPTTTKEYPNWRRRARYSLAEFCRLPGVTGTLRMVHRLRKKGGQDG